MREKHIHKIFDASLIIKALLAGFEVVGGIVAFFVTQHGLLRMVNAITQEELIRDPDDFISNYLLHAAQQFSLTNRSFVVLYLLLHGLIKLWLVIGLLQKKLWYYPTAAVVFGAFTIYQIYLALVSFSWWMIVLIVIDVVVIALTLHEYAYMKKHPRTKLEGLVQ